MKSSCAERAREEHLNGSVGQDITTIRSTSIPNPGRKVRAWNYWKAFSVFLLGAQASRASPKSLFGTWGGAMTKDSRQLMQIQSWSP